MQSKIIKYTCAFFLNIMFAGVLFCFVMTICLHQTVFNENFMNHAMDKAEFSEKITDEISASVKNVGLGSDISPSAFQKIVPESFVKENEKQYVHSIYQNEQFELSDKSKVEQNIDQSLTKYAKEKGIQIDTKNSEGITSIKKKILEESQNHIVLPYVGESVSMILSKGKYLNIIIGLFGVFIALLFFLYYKAFGSFKHRFFRQAANIISITALMFLILPVSLQMNGFIYRIGIKTKSLYAFLTTYISNLNLTFISVGVGLFVIALAMFITSEFLRKQKVKNKEVGVENL